MNKWGLNRWFVAFCVVVCIGSFTVGVAAKILVKGLERRKSAIAVTDWQIPFLNVLTGPIASIGGYLQWGAERAAAEINAAGGIAGKPVRIVGIDTGMEPANGITECPSSLIRHFW